MPEADLMAVCDATDAEKLPEAAILRIVPCSVLGRHLFEGTVLRFIANEVKQEIDLV